jgi:hypothetical protein
MTPGRFNFVCPQGATFQPLLTYKSDNVVVDLYGYSSRLQVRESYDSEEIVIGLSEGNGIYTGGSTGNIFIFIDANTTKDLIPGDHVYDLEIESSEGIVYRLLQGRFNITPEVTR